MSNIHKDKLLLDGFQHLIHGKPLAVQEQHQEVTCWYETGPAWIYQIVPTGGVVPENTQYIGSVQVHAGRFVLHMYAYPAPE